MSDINTVATNISTITAKVSKTGDTMTGALTLSGDPTNTNHASNKNYVDTQASAKAVAMAIALG